MEQNDSKKCCEWRKLFEKSLSADDKETGLECFYNWCRFGANLEKKEFDCDICQKMFKSLSMLTGYDFNVSREQQLDTTRKYIDQSGISCCLIIGKFLDPNDPNKKFQTGQAILYKKTFKDRLCPECSRKCDLVL